MDKQHSILVIDDEQIICDSCHRILENENLKVESDTNPVIGIKKAIENNYDLILLDLNMPELDGIQLLNRLRKVKPDVPVIIITGYPNKESKEVSRNLGVNNYILKPFKPNEILEPVRQLIKLTSQTLIKEKAEKDAKAGKWIASEQSYMFYQNGWLNKGSNNIVRIGGLHPVQMIENINSVKLEKVNDKVYTGLPVAELNYPNGINIFIPSPVTGKIVEVNNSIAANPALFEDDKNISDNKNWLATIQPDNLEDDLTKCEHRNVIFLTKDSDNKSSYHKQLLNLGYDIRTVSNAVDAINMFNENAENDNIQQVVIIDAKSFELDGPTLVDKLHDKLSDVKIIVFNTSDSRMEAAYREKKIFYYCVDPINSKEISSILYGAFCFSRDKSLIESNRTTFLPPTVRRIQITNRNSKKVVLLSYDNLLVFNKGIGFLLINSLLENSYPIEIDHSRNIYRMKDAASQQKISESKQKNDKVIIVCKENLNRIPGNISVITGTYENNNSNDNTLVIIAIQPEDMNSDNITFDINTTKALAKIIETEMTK